MDFLCFRVAGNSVLNLKEIDVSKKSRFEDLKNSRTGLTDGAKYRSNEGEEDGWSREKKEERGGGFVSGGGLSSGWWCGPGWNKTIQHIA